MGLENKTLASAKASLDVEIVTVDSTLPKLPDRKEIIDDTGEEIISIGYNIFIKGENLNLRPIEVGVDRKEFVERLKEGDKLLIIKSGELYLSVYGPLEEDKLYNCGREI